MNHDIVALGDVCEFLDNQRVPITESDRKPGPYPYYGANGQQDSIDSYIFDEPLVLLAEDGGYFGSKDRPIAYKVTGKCWVNNHAHVLRPKSNIDVDYLHRVLSYYDVTKYINGTTRQKLTKGNAENISFPLPPLTEQKRIASLLARADRLRHLRRTAHDLGDALLQSVFLEMFGDLSANPKGWDIATLEDLETDFIYGTSQKCFSEPKGYPVLRIPNVLHSKIDLDDLKYAEVPEKEAKNILLKHGDIIFVRTNGNPDYVGRCAVFNLDKDFLFASYLIRARVDLSKINPLFLLTFLQTTKGREAMAPYIRTTAGQSNIGIEGLGQIPVPLPPLSLQEEFAVVVARVESLRGRMSEGERQVEGLFESLLAESFGG